MQQLGLGQLLFNTACERAPGMTSQDSGLGLQLALLPLLALHQSTRVLAYRPTKVSQLERIEEERAQLTSPPSRPTALRLLR